MQVAKTLNCLVLCPFPLFVALCDHNHQRYRQTEGRTDGRHARSIKLTKFQGRPGWRARRLVYHPQCLSWSRLSHWQAAQPQLLAMSSLRPWHTVWHKHSQQLAKPNQSYRHAHPVTSTSDPFDLRVNACQATAMRWIFTKFELIAQVVFLPIKAQTEYR